MVARGRRGNGWSAACPTGRMGKRGSIGWLDGWMFDVMDLCLGAADGWMIEGGA